MQCLVSFKYLALKSIDRETVPFFKTIFTIYIQRAFHIWNVAGTKCNVSYQELNTINNVTYKFTRLLR